MLTIHLHNLRFHSFHGLYAEEKKTGNEFEVNLDVSYKEKKKIHTLADTINYESLFQIVQTCMGEPADLLEEAGLKIIQQVHKQFPVAVYVHVSIFKLHAPIGQLQGKTGISLSKKFGD